MPADGKFIIPAIYNDIYGTNINRYLGLISLTFPLLCYDGKNWKYVTRSGATLPFTASNIAQRKYIVKEVSFRFKGILFAFYATITIMDKCAN